MNSVQSFYPGSGNEGLPYNGDALVVFAKSCALIAKELGRRVDSRRSFNVVYRYRSGPLAIHLTNYQTGPELEVTLKRRWWLRKTTVLECRLYEEQLVGVTTFKPGAWCGHLQRLRLDALAQKLTRERREEARNFAPVDDAALFGGAA